MAITTIRPTADENDGAWLDDGGAATLFAHVADNSDATYIVGTVGYPSYGYYCSLLAGDVTALTATQRVMRVRVRARFSKSVGGATPDQFCSISMIDTHTRKRMAMQAIRAITSSLRDITFPWWTFSMLGPDWGATPATTTTLINRLAFVCHANNNYAGAAAFVRIFELYCDVDIHERVTISGVVATGATTTATPTISWTYNSNADLDPQRSYQVKVFTLAQTTVAGFDADADEAVWDSGQVRSTNTSVVVQTALVNGVSYVAYVRVASDFNSTDWWTDYTATSTIAMNYTAPPTPTLTVTQETTLPSLRNLLVVDTKLNLLSADDASFENGLGSWGAQTNATIVQSATQALHGTQSMRLTATGAGNMSAISAGGVFPYQVKAGQQYTVLASFRAAVTGRSCRVAVQWVDQTGANLGAVVNGSNVTDTTSGWTQAFVTATAPAGVYGVRLIAEVLSAGAAEQHFVDQMSLHTGTSTTWFVGGLQKDGSFGNRLDRTVIEYVDRHIATAETTNILYANIATGGDANGDTHGFATRHPEDIIDVDRLGRQHQGEVCIRWQIGETTGSVLDLGTAQGVFSSFTETPEATLPGVPGRTYPLSLRVRAVAGSHDMALALVGIDQAGAVVGSATVGSTVSVGTSYSQLSVVHTMPAGAAGMRGELRNLNGDLAEYLIDSGQLEEGSAPMAWRRPSFWFPSWQPVRGALTALQGDVRDGIARIYDREAPPGVIRLYRAWTESQVDASTVIRSSFTAYISTTIDPFGGPDAVLKDPQQPAWDLLVRVQQRGERIDEDATEFHPIRPNDRQPFGKRPVTVSDWISGKNGQMSIFVDNDQDWLALQALLHTPRTLLLQFPEGGQRYIRFSSRSWPVESKAGQDGAVAYWRRIVADFSEVSRPVVTG